MSLTKRIASKISSKLGYDEEKSNVIAYGLFAVMQILASLFLVAIFGIILGILVQALIFSFTASILRQYSGGAHASDPGICLIVGTAATVGLTYLAHILMPILSDSIIIALQAFVMFYGFYIVIKKAPVDSAAKPIKSEKKKNKMKNLSIFVLSFYLLVIIIFIVVYFKHRQTILFEYSVCICFAIFWQSFNLTKVGHKALSKLDSFLKIVLKKN